MCIKLGSILNSIFIIPICHKVNQLKRHRQKIQLYSLMDSAPITEQQPAVPEQRVQNQQQKHQNEQQIKAAQASRRSRKDIEGRDFVCGCGKKYLSYPALYTHIKTKHQGRQPEGTMKYSTTAPAKKSKNKLEQQHLNYLVSLVKRQDIKLMDLLAPKFEGSTPLSARLKSKILQKPITDTYHSLLKTASGSLKINKQTSLQTHLVAWLVAVGQHITQKLHDQYQWFARSVKDCYYQMGNEVYNKCFSKKDGGLCYVPHFKVEKVKYFPLICDFYIRFFLPYEYTDLNANLMELILTDFCNWLNRRKSTFIEIVLNKEYKLTAPLKIQQDTKNDQQKGSPEDDEDKCDLSELLQPDSQKGQESKQDKKNQLELENDQNHIDQLLNDDADQVHNKNIAEDNQKIISSANEFNAQEIVNQQRKSQISNTEPINIKNSHQNWSLRPQPAEELSQQIPQVDQGPQLTATKQRFQSDVLQHDLMRFNKNANEDAQLEKL